MEEVDVENLIWIGFLFLPRTVPFMNAKGTSESDVK